MWKWTIWLSIIAASFAAMEAWSLLHNTPTLSRWVWTVSADFPPFGWLCGFLTGFLACHFWWGGIVSFAPVKRKDDVMRSLLALAVCVSMLSPAFAGDIAKPAPKPNPLFSGYPYASQGFYWGLNSIGGGGRVDATGIGVNPNAIVTNEIAAGLTVGYVWATKDVFYAFEAMFDVKNFNGSAPGFSMSGPASFEQRFKIGTPLSNFLAALPSLPFGGSGVPPFPTLPGGAVATNVHPYLMAGLHEDDVSIDYGLNNAKAWRVSPSIGIGMMGQLTNGVAIDVWVETEFTQSGFCAGVACVSNGQKYLAGVAILY